jgi:hypothetical protein
MNRGSSNKILGPFLLLDILLVYDKMASNTIHAHFRCITLVLIYLIVISRQLYKSIVCPSWSRDISTIYFIVISRQLLIKAP